MFTIKVIRQDTQTAYCCEIYHIKWEKNHIVEFDITPRASAERESYKVRVAPRADFQVAIYIENANGKTIETIRLPKVKADDLLKRNVEHPSEAATLHFISRYTGEFGKQMHARVQMFAKEEGFQISVDREAPYFEIKAQKKS